MNAGNADGMGCITCRVKSKEGVQPKDGAAESVGRVHAVEAVTVDADEQMLEKLYSGSRVRDAENPNCLASAAKAANVLSDVSAAKESGRQRCSELEFEEGTVSFWDSSDSARPPISCLCHGAVRFLGVWAGCC